MQPLFAISLALLCIGLIAGTIIDRPPTRPVVKRAGYRVLEGDFHAHTRFSDGFLSPFGVVLQAERRGLDVVGITEHNYVFPSKLGRWFSQLVGGPLVITGSEITRKRYHLIVLGQKSRIDPMLPLKQVIREVHKQGAVAIAAHPVRKFWPAFIPLLKELDGAEVMHPLAFSQGRSPNRWRWSDMVIFHDWGREAHGHWAAIGSSDYHFFSPLGVVRTLLFVETPDAHGVLEAIKAGRTVTVSPKGRLFGPPKLVAALKKQPLAVRTSDYNYQGRGWLDWITRLLAFFGLIGTLVFRPKSGTGS